MICGDFFVGVDEFIDESERCENSSFLWPGFVGGSHKDTSGVI
jgi:hypothetical protein